VASVLLVHPTISRSTAPRKRRQSAKGTTARRGTAFGSPFACAPFRGILRGTVRTIRRYSNRKLYDLQDSHYVKLEQLAAIIRAGDEVQVLEHPTGKDITAATMALIISEEEKQRPRLPVAALRKIILTGQIA
jgi:polyhydroxyalkanoate synthesis repressor PhaR